MKFKKLVSALAVAAAFASGTASATPFYFFAPDSAAAVGGDAGKQTATMTSFGISFSASSTYTDSDNSYMGGDVRTFVTPGDAVTDVGSGNVSSFLQANGSAFTGNSNLEGFGNDWGLTFDYTDLVGTVFAVDNSNPAGQGIGALYTSGTINLYRSVLDEDNGNVLDEILVFSLLVTSSGGTIGNAVINAAVDFTNTQDLDFAQGFFFENGQNWYELWANGDPLPSISIAARIDTNVDPQLVPTCDGNECATASRSNTLNGSVQFEVPEPGMLALLGLGLFGLGVSRRFKKTA